MNKLQVEIDKKILTREARRLEQIMRKRTGIDEVSISTSGIIQVNWDEQHIKQGEIIDCIQKMGLKITSIHNTETHTQHIEDDHSHFHLDILGENTELYFAIISGVFWITGVVFSLTAATELVATTLFVIGAFFGGVFTFISGGKDLLRGKFEIDFLMLFAAIGAATLGKWGERALLLFLFSLGHALEHYAMKRARKSISAIYDLAPRTAFLKQTNFEILEVHIENL